MVAEQGTPSLHRTTIHLLGAQVLRNLAPILLLFLLARFTDQATVGQFSLVLAIASPFFVFAQLGLRTVALTLNPDAAFRDYVITQVGSVALALVAVVVAGAISTPSLLLVVFFVGLLKIADAFSDFLSGPLQRRHRSQTVLIASLIYAVVASAAAAAALALTQDLALTILSVAIVSLLAMYFFLYLPARRVARAPGSSPTSRVEIRRILAAGVPLGITAAILALISSFPQYVITASQGEAETARFAVLLYVYALADLATGTVAQAWIPVAQEHLARGAGAKTLGLALRSALRWTLVYIPITVVGLFATSMLFPIVFDGDYTLSVAEAIPLGLAIVALPFAHFTAIAVAIENYYAHSLLLAVISTGVAVLGCLTLIPAFGLTGAFISLFASVVMRALVAGGILLWYLKAPTKGVAP